MELFKKNIVTKGYRGTRAGLESGHADNHFALMPEQMKGTKNSCGVQRMKAHSNLTRVVVVSFLSAIDEYT